MPRTHQIQELCDASGAEHTLLASIEGLGKAGIGDSVGSWCKAECAFAEEELCCGVDCEAEEQTLQINSRSISRNGFDEMLNMGLKCIQIGNLRSMEVWPQHLSRMLPVRAIACEYADAQERRKGDLASPTEGPLFEV